MYDILIFAFENCFTNILYMALRCQAFTNICNYVVCCMLSPHFALLTSEHFYNMNERTESRLMNTDIGLLDKPDSQIGIKLLAYVSPEKIAFPCEVFLKFCLIFVYHTF